MNEELRTIIVKSFGLEGASIEVQDQLIEQAGMLVYQGALMRSMELLSEEEVDAFEALMNTDANPDQIFAFLKEHVEGFENIVNEEALEFQAHAQNVMSATQG